MTEQEAIALLTPKMLSGLYDTYRLVMPESVTSRVVLDKFGEYVFLKVNKPLPKAWNGNRKCHLKFKKTIKEHKIVTPKIKGKKFKITLPEINDKYTVAAEKGTTIKEKENLSRYRKCLAKKISVYALVSYPRYR